MTAAAIPLEPKPVMNQTPECTPASTEGPNTSSSKLPSGLKQLSPLTQTVPAVKPANFVSLKREVVSGTFAIDPTLKVPPWLQAAQPAPQPEPEWNLHLTSTSAKLDRFSDVEIHLVPGEEGVESSNRSRTKLCVASSNGAQVKLLVRSSETGHRAPYLLQVSTSNFARVYIPPDFRGLLIMKLSTNNDVFCISPQLSRNTATFSEESTKRTCFVGSLTRSERSEQEWRGDQINVEITKAGSSKGIWVGYVGETDSRQRGAYYRNPFIALLTMIGTWVLAPTSTALVITGVYIWVLLRVK